MIAAGSDLDLQERYGGGLLQCVPCGHGDRIEPITARFGIGEKPTHMLVLFFSGEFSHGNQQIRPGWKMVEESASRDISNVRHTLKGCLAIAVLMETFDSRVDQFTAHGCSTLSVWSANSGFLCRFHRIYSDLIVQGFPIHSLYSLLNAQTARSRRNKQELKKKFSCLPASFPVNGRLI